MSKKTIAFLLLTGITTLHICCAPLDVRLGIGDGDGVGLAYRIVGSGDALVVIHDGPGYEKGLMYQGFDGLASDLRVIYYDQRGCGKSPPISPLISSTIADNVEDLDGLRRYFYLNTISIAAHGWGAVIALEYARRYPEHVSSIILVTPMSPFLPQPRLDSVIDELTPSQRDEFWDLLNHPSMSMLEIRERTMRLLLPLLFHKEEALRLVRLRNIRLSPDVNIRLGDELKSLNLYPVLGEINIPTLVVIGRHDASTSVMDQMAYADGISTSSAIVFNQSGHFPFLEERALFLKVAREFLIHHRIPALVHAGPEPSSR